MDTVGILSILEGEPYKKVWELWKYFENEYHSTGVQSFDHPNLSFQGGNTENLQELSADFIKTIPMKVRPYKVQVVGLGHFDKNAIYLKVKKSRSLARINEIANKFLEVHCCNLFERYSPENWVPHVTLAMSDLTVPSFNSAWDALGRANVRFKQTIHNICLVKQESESQSP
jgi:2'-5' RNA ligase